MKTEIIPAILPQSLNELESELARIKGSVKTVQIDVVDGEFAPNTTWPYTDRSAFETILSEDEGLPFWEDFNFEVDLMVTHALQDAKDWVGAGAARIIVHLESADALQTLEALQEFESEGGGPGVEIAAAISLDTALDLLEGAAHFVSEIQVMGIENIGFQGQKFDTRALDRIRELKEKYPSHIIGIDGGVTLENIASIIDAGASRIAVGSAIFTADDPKEIYGAFVRATLEN